MLTVQLRNQNSIDQIYIYIHSLCQCQYHSLDYCRFIVNFIFPLFRIILALLDLLHFHIKFRVCLSIFTKKDFWNFDWNIIETVEQFVKKWQFNNLGLSDTRTLYISTFMSNFSQQCFTAHSAHLKNFFLQVCQFFDATVNGIALDFCFPSVYL